MGRIVLTFLAMFALNAHLHAADQLHFPSESIGTVSIRELQTDAGDESTPYSFPPGLESHWRDGQPAVGTVTIPDGAMVHLKLNATAANDLSWIDELTADAVDVLEAYGVPLGDEGFARLARFASLRYISLSQAGLTSSFATSLKQFPDLRYLSIGANSEVDDRAMAAIAALPRLEYISVFGTGVTDAGLESLAMSHSIRYVNIGRCDITDVGFGALAKLPNLRGISAYAKNPKSRVAQSNPTITDQGIEYLALCPKLEQLNLTGNALSDAGVERLVEVCPNLKNVNLDHNAVTSKGLKHMGGLSRLELLRCYGPKIDDSVVAQFLALGKLRYLCGDIEVTSAGASDLATLPSLERLPLSGPVDDECMGAIASMASLKELSLQHTQVSDEGFSLLEGAPNLERVQITGNKVTTRCLETLATMPKLKQLGLMTIKARDDGVPVWAGLGDLKTLVETDLWISECARMDADDFAQLGNLTNLQMLQIHGGRLLTDADLQNLNRLKKLSWLQLSSSVISDEGANLLSTLPSLEHLFINCRFTSDGLKQLATLPRLQHLHIGSPDLSDKDVELIASKHPNVSIERTEFRVGMERASRSTSSDGFLRQGAEAERTTLNSLEGKLAPDISVEYWLRDQHIEELQELRGKVVLLRFWGTWCGPCRAQLPDIRRLHDKYAKRGLAIVGIHSTRDAASVSEYVEENEIPWAIGVDKTDLTKQAYAVPHWPSVYLIDRSGLLKMANPIHDQLDAAIEMLLSEEQAK